ncbi:MAG: PAS domain-containing protein [Pseudomonadota bacterium]
MSQWPSGITDAQSELVAVLASWSDAYGEIGVRQSDFDPGAVRRHLSHLSIMQCDEAGQFRFRFIGSALPQLFQLDLKTAATQQDATVLPQAWRAPVTEVAEQRLPICSSTPLVGRRFRHAWLRIPMFDSHGLVSQVLCHDSLVSAGEVGRWEVIHTDIHGEEITLAA